MASFFEDASINVVHPLVVERSSFENRSGFVFECPMSPTPCISRCKHTTSQITSRRRENNCCCRETTEKRMVVAHEIWLFLSAVRGLVDCVPQALTRSSSHRLTGMPHHEFEAQQQPAQMKAGHQYTYHKLVAGIILGAHLAKKIVVPVRVRPFFREVTKRSIIFIGLHPLRGTRFPS